MACILIMLMVFGRLIIFWPQPEEISKRRIFKFFPTFFQKSNKPFLCVLVHHIHRNTGVYVACRSEICAILKHIQIVMMS